FMNDITLRQILNQDLIAIKENLFLVEFQNKKYVLKGKRSKERNPIQNFRFQNELTFYRQVRELNYNNDYLNVPDHFISSNPEMLLLDYITIDEGKFHKHHFVKAYLEFQTLQIDKNILIEPYHQLIN